MTMDQRFQVLVLMATYNGGPWLSEQIESILNQTGVAVKILISDDGSTDDTPAILAGFQGDSRIQVVSTGRRHGSAARNFFYLLTQSTLHECTHVALADQDDIWHPEKLARAIEVMQKRGVAAVSTNVTAFWPDGREQLVRKDQQPGKWNHFFESAGPGCSYVLECNVAHTLASALGQYPTLADRIDFHDWLIYEWVRARGHGWLVDSWPSLRYRQHDHNVFGAHAGWRKRLQRWRLLRSGWYRQQVLLIARFCGEAEHLPCMQRLQRFRLLDRLVLATQVMHMRRKSADRLALAMAYLLGKELP